MGVFGAKIAIFDIKMKALRASRRCPTIVGFILSGRDRLKHFPDAWIQAGRFEGRDRSGILNHVELIDMMPTAIDFAIIFLRKRDERRADIGDIRRVRRQLGQPNPLHSTFKDVFGPVTLSLWPKLHPG